MNGIDQSFLGNLLNRKVSESKPEKMVDVKRLFEERYLEITEQNFKPWSKGKFQTTMNEQDRIYGLYFREFYEKGLPLLDLSRYLNYALKNWLQWIDGDRSNVVGFVCNEKTLERYQRRNKMTKEKTTNSNMIAGKKESWLK